MFAGWEPGIAIVRSNAVYKATYTETVNKYDISFVDDDGTVLQSEKLEYGQTPVYKGAVPSKEDPTGQYIYSFKEWQNTADEKPVSAVSGDATYKAVYTEEIRKYEIRWLDDDGSLIDTTQAEYGKIPSHADPDKKVTPQYTYEFKGWKPEPATVSGDAEYMATYKESINKYKIEFVDHSGTTTLEAGYGTAIKDIRPVDPEGYEDPKAVYTFVRWEPESLMVTGDQTFTAVYDGVDKKYTVRFDMNGAESETISEQELGYDERIKEPAEPGRSDKNFAGWFTTDGVKWNFSTRIKGELTLRAQWIEKSEARTINGVEVMVAEDDLQGTTISNRYNDKPLVIITGNGIVVVPAGLEEDVNVPLIENNFVKIDLSKAISLADSDHMYGIYLDVKKSDIHDNIIKADKINGYTETINSGFDARFMEIYDNKGNRRQYDYPGRAVIALDLEAMNIRVEDAKEGYVRTHLLAHNYSGSNVEYLTLSISADKKTGTFSVSTLSPFALVYKDNERVKPRTPEYIPPKTGN